MNLLSLSFADVLAAAAVLFLSSAAINRLTAKGPMMWPVLGGIPTVLYHMADIYDWATTAVLGAGGTFPFRGMWLGGYHGVITIDPANIEYVLKTRFRNFPKGRYYQERFGDLLGEGIFNADDECWREQRRAATAEMHSSRFAEYSFDAIQRLVQHKLLPLFKHLAEDDRTIDLQDVFLRFTFDNICAAAFGVDTGCLALDLPEVPFAQAFEEATELSLFRFIVPPFVWKAMRAFDVGTEKRLKAAVHTVHEFAEDTVSKRRSELLRGLDDNRSDLLSRLMKADAGHSNKFLKDFCISFILAGRDTSSVALTWFFWLLNTHPHVERWILDEISTVLGRQRRPNDVVLTADELKRMHYLQAALSESLRLYPSVPIDFKEVVDDDVLPDSTKVRKGARVIYSIYSMARSEAIWGKDCREFRPERWMTPDGEFASENQFKYPVFNAGPRLCIGKKFAYMQMKMVAASVLMRFHVEVVGGQEVVPKMTTTLYMKNGLKVTVRPRDY